LRIFSVANSVVAISHPWEDKTYSPIIDEKNPAENQSVSLGLVSPANGTSLAAFPQGPRLIILERQEQTEYGNSLADHIS
jgi:hypothetical protein